MKQERGPGRRTWFESDGLELVVWLGEGDRVAGFQLCYDLGRGEHALTWREGAGFAHSVIDTGDATPLKNETPVLLPNAHTPWRQIARLFDERSELLEPALRQLIREKLTERASASAER